jgi:5-methylcytosine-specific restriction endonuclease McrA
VSIVACFPASGGTREGKAERGTLRINFDRKQNLQWLFAAFHSRKGGTRPIQPVLRRDGWRCQACGTMSNLEVHHKEFRSHSGDDSELNLITLCSNRHGRQHRS